MTISVICSWFLCWLLPPAGHHQGGYQAAACLQAAASSCCFYWSIHAIDSKEILPFPCICLAVAVCRTSARGDLIKLVNSFYSIPNGGTACTSLTDNKISYAWSLLFVAAGLQAAGPSCCFYRNILATDSKESFPSHVYCLLLLLLLLPAGHHKGGPQVASGLQG
jgi:hypothetical protein